MGKETFTSIVCEKVTMTFNGQSLLHDIDLQIVQGERVAVVGPNAAGKSTLLKIISGELPPSNGQVLLNGREIPYYTFKKRARILTKVPQRTKIIADFSVQEYVSMGRYPYQRLTSRFGKEDQEAVQKALLRTNLENLAERSVRELSGGEQQRALLAQALAQETPLLILDEPNSYLDLRYQLELMELLMRLNMEDGLTVVTVLHDLNSAVAFADRVILMDKGRILGEGKPWDILTEANIEKAYGVKAEKIELPGFRQLHFAIDK